LIHDVDESLRALLRTEAFVGSEVEVVLDAPTKEWASRRNAPTVDLYLYDIREAPDQSQMGEVELRGDDGIITGRRPHPRVFKLSYLLTVWTQRPEDEHRILSTILAHLLQYDLLPESVLQGTLVGSSQPVQLRVAQPPPQDRSVSDVWSAMGGELKPSLDLVVLAPLEAGVLAQAGPPVIEEPKFHFDPGSGAGEAVGGGRVERPSDETEEPETDEAGVPLPAEDRTGGLEGQPGRVFRIRATR
jgi:hypothetical protein